MFRRTKIICTIGPAVRSKEKILALMDAGMDIARLNFSHGTHKEHLEVIERLKEARSERGQPLAIMLDTKGPEIRLGKIPAGPMTLQSGQRWRLLKEEVDGDEEKVTIRPGSVLDDLDVGMTVLFANGLIKSHVVEVKDDGVVVEVENHGEVATSKGVNIPGATTSLPAVTDKDIEDLKFGCQNDIDLVAASFIRSADHVIAIKKLLAEAGKPEILVVAKIENAEGITNFDDIVHVADGIMIARGDLGVEIPLTHVPGVQKRMIRKCNLAGKPSVTATQMLRSMVSSPIPSRAETSDVFNAIFDGTSAVMLSEETAIGEYPVETVNVMREIIVEAEKEVDYRLLFDQHTKLVYSDVPSSVTLATVKTAYSSSAKAILAFTRTGNTAKLLSRLRPKMPILGITTSEKTYQQMALYWGVIPMLTKNYQQDFEEAFNDASRQAIEKGYIGVGDLVLITSGAHFGIKGNVNMMRVENIGDVLVRGAKGWGKRVYGPVAFAFSADNTDPFMVRDHILVITRCDTAYIPLLQEAKGIVLHNHVDDVESEAFLESLKDVLKKPCIVHADGATTILHEKQFVTLVPDKAIVYKGYIEGTDTAET